MNKKKAVLSILAVFVFGCISGGAAMKMFVDQHMMRMMKGPPQLPKELILGKMTNDLDLDAKQREFARTLLSEYAPKFDKVFKETKPKMDALMAELAGRLEAVLDGEQKGRLWALVEHMKKHGPPPPPPPGSAPKDASK